VKAERVAFFLSKVLFNLILEFLARAIRQEEEIKGIQIGKETAKISLFTDNMILYLKDPKHYTQKLFATINSYSKLAGYKISLQKSLAYTPITNKLKRICGNNSIYNSLKKNQILRSKLNKGCE
jgi:hypothetical protein